MSWFPPPPAAGAAEVLEVAEWRGTRVRIDELRPPGSRRCVVLALLVAGADLEGAKDNGATALHEAAYRGNTDMLRLLLDAGANACAATRSCYWYARSRCRCIVPFPM